MDRRQALKAAFLAPVAAVLAPRADATDYADAAEVFRTIDGLEADVATRLRAIAGALASAKALAGSCLADHDRHRAARERLRRRWRLPKAAPEGREVPNALALDALRGAQEALVYAHAEGLPALGDPVAVGTLARHMVDLSRHLTVIDLWIESVPSRG